MRSFRIAAGGGRRSDAVERGQERADLVVLERALDVRVELAQPPTQHVEVLAGATDLEAVRGVVVPTDGRLRRLDEPVGEVLADLVSAGAAELREPLPRQPEERLGSGVLVEDRRGELGVEAADELRELEEPEFHEAMQWPTAITEVLHQAVAEADELAELLGGAVWQPPDHRPLRSGEAGDAESIDGVGLRPLEILAGEPPRPQRVEQGHAAPRSHERGEEVLPGVARRLHRDEDVARRPEQPEQFLVPARVLGDGR